MTKQEALDLKPAVDYVTRKEVSGPVYVGVYR